jgi:hypothetical protein
MKPLHALSLAALLLGGCRRAHEWTDPPYATTDVSPTTRVMLVAGGEDVANFAAEVDRQHRIWRRAGVAEDDIACYWAKPTSKALREDQRQYASLSAKMSGCAEASAARVLDDITRVAQSAPPYFYLYITAHGVPTLGGREHAWVLPPDEREFLSQPALALDADRAVRVGDTAALLTAWREHTYPKDRITLTPQTLAAALAQFPDETHKIVVLQGCFSGGFLVGESALVSVPNTTVLTAAAANRPSFGCGPGTRETFWGGALGRELDDVVRRGTTPDRVPWHEVHEAVARRVRHLERTLGQRPSKPQFGESKPGESKPGESRATAACAAPARTCR